MTPADDVEVMRYYKNRRLWIADVDENTVRISRYEPLLQLNAVAQSPWEQPRNFVLNIHRTE